MWSPYSGRLVAEFECCVCATVFLSKSEVFMGSPLELPAKPNWDSGWTTHIHPGKGVVWCCPKHALVVSVVDKPPLL